MSLLGSQAFSAELTRAYRGVSLEDPTPLSGFWVEPNAINDHTQTVGMIETLDGPGGYAGLHPVVWDAEGALSYLPVTPVYGTGSQEPLFITDAGVIYGVARSYGDGAMTSVLRWESPTSPPTVLPGLTVPWVQYQTVPLSFRGANQSGQVLVGPSGFRGEPEPGGVYDVATGTLEPLAGFNAPPGLSVRYTGLAGISDAGTVFGNAFLVDEAEEQVGGAFPLRWDTPDAAPVSLGVEVGVSLRDLTVSAVSRNGTAAATATTAGRLPGSVNPSSRQRFPVRFAPGRTVGEALGNQWGDIYFSDAGSGRATFLGNSGYRFIITGVNDQGDIVATAETEYFGEYEDPGYGTVWEYMGYGEEFGFVWSGDDGPAFVRFAEFTGPINNHGAFTNQGPEGAGLLFGGVFQPFDALVGDHNLDDRVDQGDLDLVLQNWGEYAPFQNATRVETQAGSVRVGQSELDAVLQNWGGVLPPDLHGFNPAAVPEPGAVGALGVLAVRLSRRRRVRR